MENYYVTHKKKCFSGSRELFEVELRADNTSEYEKRQLFNWTEEVEEVEMIIYPKDLKRIEDSNKIKLVDFFRVSTKYISFALFIVINLSFLSTLKF